MLSEGIEYSKSLFERRFHRDRISNVCCKLYTFRSSVLIFYPWQNNSPFQLLAIKYVVVDRYVNTKQTNMQLQKPTSVYQNMS